MEIPVSGHHITITDSLRAYVHEKLARVERHFDHLVKGQVILTVDHKKQIAEVSLHVTGQDVHAKAEHDDMYAAIDLMVDKLDRQVLKYKEKMTDHHAREGGLKQRPEA